LIYAKGSFDIFLPTLFCFLFCYLIALALARISDLSDSLGSRLPGFNLQWASGIGLAALCMVIISLLLSKIINLDVAEFLGSGLSLLIQLVVGAIVLITSPILLAVVAVIQFLFKLLAPNLNNMLNQTELDAGNKLLEDLQNQITKTTNFDPRLLIMIGVLLLIVILAILQLRWKPWQRITRGEDGLSETAGNFRLSNPLKNLFPSITQRRRRKSATSLIAAARIRHIYAQLMNLCEKLGKPRPRSLTPNEFLPQMYNLFPLNQKELGTITEAYINVRYGELPETNEDIREVLDAWQRISAFGKMTLDERSKARH
jgi:hypothetical protein